MANIWERFAPQCESYYQTNSHFHKKRYRRRILQKFKRGTPTKSFRSISNTSVISKLLERLDSKQLMRYLKDNDLLPDLQSAYRAHHSTETAILRVLSDISAGFRKPSDDESARPVSGITRSRSGCARRTASARRSSTGLRRTSAAEHNKFTQRHLVRCHRQSTLESRKVRSLDRFVSPVHCRPVATRQK